LACQSHEHDFNFQAVYKQMTNDLETPRARGFVPSILPWVLAALMLGVFAATLSRSINPYNIGNVISLADWRQNPDAFGPVAFLVTYPLRWLPANLLSQGLNVLSAVFGALTLALLARSVALLPHDRTHEQREREDSEVAILTSRFAWIPPIFAVLVCGLQRTFWEHATLGTGETFNLLLFAYVIRCLLEYRISAKESWLTRFAIVYGLGMANDWAMIAFLPLFLGAMLWIKGLPALNPRFLLRIFGLLLAGASLMLLLPALDTIYHTNHQGFWQMLKGALSSDKKVFTMFPRDVVAIMALTSILPVFVMGIRWASYFGDNSPLGIFLATSMFHIVHAMFLLAGLWVMLDSPISPRVMGFGFPFLPLYYLSALSIGYLSGYFLLVFGQRKSREMLHPIVASMKWGVVVCVWLLLLAIPALQVFKNAPHIRALKVITQTYDNHFAEIGKLLPSQGAVVLSDDAFRLTYLKTIVNQDGGHSPNLYVDTGRLETEPDYLNELQKDNPGYQICGPWTNIPPNVAPAIAKIQLLQHLATSHGVYYLHPSFGYFFEAFYAEPHGTVYQLKPYPHGTWDVPALPHRLIAENEAFWQKTSSEVLSPLVEYLNQSSQPLPLGLWKTIMDRLHLKPEQEALAVPVSLYYARELNEWGGQLQLAGMRKEADVWFDRVMELNPGSIAARVNKAFDENIAKGKKISIQSSKDIEKALDQFSGGWSEVLRSDGPVDEPSFRCQVGWILANGFNYRQGVQQFNRARALVPGDFRIPLQLAKILVDIQTYTNGLALQLPYTECYEMALTNLDSVLNTYTNEPHALLMKSFVLMQMQSYDKAIAPLSHALEQPIDTNSYIAAELYRGIAYYKTGNYTAAKADYQAVSQSIPRSYQAYYGLGEIAYQQKDKPSAIKNYELYLTNAPTNTEEARSVNARLKELKSGAP
jgi:tetratricopeptide (TPR) repeat protein